MQACFEYGMVARKDNLVCLKKNKWSMPDKVIHGDFIWESGDIYRWFLCRSRIHGGLVIPQKIDKSKVMFIFQCFDENVEIM